MIFSVTKRSLLILSLIVFSYTSTASSLPRLRDCTEQKDKPAYENLFVQGYQGEEIIPLLTLLNKWANVEFAHYPYLYAPPEDQLVCPSDILFINSKDALIALAKQDEEILGMAAMICFDAPNLSSYFDPSLYLKVRDAGFDPNKMLYVAYFLTAPQCHNDPIVVNALYDAIVRFAQEKQKTQLWYMDDISQFDVAFQDNYCIEPWNTVIKGFKNSKVMVSISWPTRLDNKTQMAEHTLEFFVKDIQAQRSLKE
jgi:hypothetical protein